MENKVPNIPCDERYFCWDFYAVSLSSSPCACKCCKCTFVWRSLDVPFFKSSITLLPKEMLLLLLRRRRRWQRLLKCERHRNTHTKNGPIECLPNCLTLWIAPKWQTSDFNINMSVENEKKRSIYAFFSLFVSVWCILLFAMLNGNETLWCFSPPLAHFILLSEKYAMWNVKKMKKKRAHLLQLLSKFIWDIFKFSFSFSVIHTTHRVRHIQNEFVIKSKWQSFSFLRWISHAEQN